MKRAKFRTLLYVVVFMYLMTFCVVLPIACWNLPFSRYYFHHKRTESLERAVAKDVAKGQAADNYFSQLNQIESLAFHAEALQSSSSKYAIGIITVKRQSSEFETYHPRYLSRVVAEFDRLLKISNRKDIILLICNAQTDPNDHQEAQNLTKYVTSVGKIKNVRKELTPYSKIREQEKKDYVFCMNEIQKFNAEYSILVQDDAVPYPQFISRIDRLMETHIENKITRGQIQPNYEKWVAVKFYFPEKWQGFGNERPLIIEFIAGALFGGGVLYGLCRLFCNSYISFSQSTVIFIVFCTYCGLAMFIVGRPYLMMLRRFSVDLHGVRGAPECCIPAVLYKSNALPDIQQHLKMITCTVKNPLDVAISRFFQSRNEKQYLVMPNLFNHIGLFSSLHPQAKSPHEFMG